MAPLSRQHSINKNQNLALNLSPLVESWSILNQLFSCPLWKSFCQYRYSPWSCHSGIYFLCSTKHQLVPHPILVSTKIYIQDNGRCCVTLSLPKKFRSGQEVSLVTLYFMSNSLFEGKYNSEEKTSLSSPYWVLTWIYFFLYMKENHFHSYAPFSESDLISQNLICSG